MEVEEDGTGCKSLFSLLSVESRSTSRRTLRAPVTLRAVLPRPLDIAIRRDEVAVGVASCICPDETRENCREGGASATDGALSERDKEARVEDVRTMGVGLSDGLWL